MIFQKMHASTDIGTGSGQSLMKLPGLRMRPKSDESDAARPSDFDDNQPIGGSESPRDASPSAGGPPKKRAKISKSAKEASSKPAKGEGPPASSKKAKEAPSKPAKDPAASSKPAKGEGPPASSKPAKDPLASSKPAEEASSKQAKEASSKQARDPFASSKQEHSSPVPRQEERSPRGGGLLLQDGAAEEDDPSPAYRGTGVERNNPFREASHEAPSPPRRKTREGVLPSLAFIRGDKDEVVKSPAKEKSPLPGLRAEQEVGSEQDGICSGDVVAAVQGTDAKQPRAVEEPPHEPAKQQASKRGRSRSPKTNLEPSPRTSPAQPPPEAAGQHEDSHPGPPPKNQKTAPSSSMSITGAVSKFSAPPPPLLQREFALDERRRREGASAEKARLEAEAAAEKAHLEAEEARRLKARLEAEAAAEKARLEAEEARRLKARLEFEAAKKARREAEAAEKARLEFEAAEKARLEAEAAEKVRLAASLRTAGSPSVPAKSSSPPQPKPVRPAPPPHLLQVSRPKPSTISSRTKLPQQTSQPVVVRSIPDVAGCPGVEGFQVPHSFFSLPTRQTLLRTLGLQPEAARWYSIIDLGLISDMVLMCASLQPSAIFFADKDPARWIRERKRDGSIVAEPKPEALERESRGQSPKLVELFEQFERERELRTRAVLEHFLNYKNFSDVKTPADRADHIRGMMRKLVPEISPGLYCRRLGDLCVSGTGRGAREEPRDEDHRLAMLVSTEKRDRERLQPFPFRRLSDLDTTMCRISPVEAKLCTDQGRAWDRDKDKWGTKIADEREGHMIYHLQVQDSCSCKRCSSTTRFSSSQCTWSQSHHTTGT